MSMICLNARFRTQKVTGVQRYATELAARLGDVLVEIEPRSRPEGLAAHLWEQCVLPARTLGRPLWNPCATGPVVKRSVVTIHDVAFLDFPEWFGRSYSAFYRAIVPRVVRNASHVICVSSSTRDRLLHWVDIPSNRVSVVLSGASTLGEPLTPEAGSAYLESLGVTPGQFFLSVGSIEPRKNLHRLLEAWGDFKARTSSRMKLVLAGGKGRSNVFAETSPLPVPPDLVWAGYVQDAELRSLYGSAHAFIYPSLYEGFGLPPLEAMAHGCPVLVSRSTSMPEVVGNAGAYFDPLDSNSIRCAIEESAEDIDGRATLSARVRERAATLSWDTCAAQVRTILERHA